MLSCFWSRAKHLLKTMDIKSCSRLVVGSDDHILSFWDLDNMNSSLKPFRTLRPIDGQPIIGISFNSKQEKLLVCGGGSQPKLLTRDGREIVEFVKGDMYVKDLKYTKGHTSNITHCKFDPYEENICYTSSVDGTLRVWDLNSKLFGVEQQLTNSMIFKTMDSQKRRLSAQYFNFINSKNAVIVFCERGNIQIFDKNNRYQRPEITCSFGFTADVTASLCLKDPTRFACRTLDDGAVRIFDIRKPNQVEKIWHGIYNNHGSTGMDVSPCGNLLVTGKSFDRNSKGGLVFLDIWGQKEEYAQEMNTQAGVKTDLNNFKGVLGENAQSSKELTNRIEQVYMDNSKPEDMQKNYKKSIHTKVDWEVETKKDQRRGFLGEVSAGMAHTTCVIWPKKLNQVLAGCGNKISVFFDRQKSRRGIIPALKRMKTKPKLGTYFILIF